MRVGRRLLWLLRWAVTLVTLGLAAAFGLSTRYLYGVVRTRPYPGGWYAPIWTSLTMLNGEFLYMAGQGDTDAPANSPFTVIGTHWRWRKIDPDMRRVSWGVRLSP